MTGAGLAQKLRDRGCWLRLADAMAVALAASLPWSTSATGIFVVLWLLALAPALDAVAIRRELTTAAGGLPVLLWLFGVAGMMWADVSWHERLGGLGSFHKLLCIPLLLAHFRMSDGGRRVMIGFLASCVALLALSWALVLLPSLPWRGKMMVGIPVKDYIAQSAMFTAAIFMLLPLGLAAWRRGARMMAAGAALLALVFLLNIFETSPSRTALVVIPVLLLLYGATRLSWKGVLGLCAALVIVTAAAWPFSAYLQTRVTQLFSEVQDFRPDAPSTSAGERLEFWRKSVGFIAAAPILGHGTGSIPDQFRRAAVGQSGMAGLAAVNPHNQTFAVAIQLGLLGALVLFAMWAAHLMLFRGGGLAAWVGLMVVTQNVVGSLFNSHLFDFTHGWAYVVGVGIAGGSVLRDNARRRPAQPL